MINFGNKESYFPLMIVLGILCSTFLSSFYLGRIENKLLHDFYGFKFILENDTPFDASLLYSYNQAFSSDYVLTDLSPATDTLFFNLPNSDRVLKKFRLDFGNKKEINPLKLKELHLYFNNDTIVIGEDKLAQKIFNTSPSVLLDKGNGIIDFRREISPFDPYIIFSPLVEITIDKKEYALFLLTPFIILLILYLTLVKKKTTPNITEILCLIFIICIPLKIAWTTFIAILLVIYGLYDTKVNKRELVSKPLVFLFLGYFCVLLFFGRPSDLSDIDMQLGLLLWAIIGATIRMPKEKIYKYYIMTFTVINAIVITSGIGFLYWFNELYGLQLTDYFHDIKLYSRDVRGWLYYDHAAFLSFFAIIGLLFLHELYQQKKVNRTVVCLYHILLVAFVLITATRIGLIIYLLVLLNVLVSLNYRLRLLVNTAALGIFSFFLFLKIESIDSSRAILWQNSWEVIKFNPFLGHGVGQSNQMLQTAYIGKDNIGLPVLELNHSHNQYLTYLLELGFIGSFALMLGLVFVLHKTKQYKNKNLIIFLFATSFLFLTESALQTSKPLYVLSFLLILVYSKTTINSCKRRK
ncbi:O-antigen ligase family protein [Maribacter sp. ACAM166]|uniref:O-antigen ligase family protein n=1 Tax=Maribacter sp. ACAM166 TaxID=2508996 RepID=UPI0010FDE2F8|nr:O-antigen ligase family protein [Maribacter sp. ACAM166]TLP80757.1 O-antigen ligase family protein [Maribacter sp. ACAM166]